MVWAVAAPAASADQIRDQQWALKTFEAETHIWPISQGEGVTVAVIDSGVNSEHQDLTGQVLPGADFSGTKSDGRIDTDGHGTAMASLIAGHGHGTQSGVMGLAPKAKILPVKVRTSDGGPVPEQNDLATAIRFAADNGAKVINLSIGGSQFDSQSRKAVAYAVSKDVVLVAATGNDGSSDGVGYPAAFPGVVAVGASDSKGVVWEDSTSGSETTLIAPGVGIYHASAKSPTSYAAGDGTSDSTAYVSATAALIRSKYPDLSAGQVINRLIKSATPPSNGTVVPNKHYGYGVLAPAKALEPNPTVDNGPKENPLVNRPESKGTPPSDDDTDATDQPTAAPVPQAASGGGGGDVTGLVVAAVAAGAVVVGASAAAVVMARRRRQAAAAVPYPPQPPYGGPGR
ncbi:type VII secretion-associated serine protease mycosin [Streptomyces sp. CBMA123]|uniref:type VII secretion-associated serine protease mycosin n=1 Tax=Streptomyces sp. CBMA123 TaxID=1896313 RepID=UPI0016620209|nr:type VII secretion-associated serine protease mycosin [Streptomyces sp. CBMA123]